MASGKKKTAWARQGGKKGSFGPALDGGRAVDE